MSYVLYYTVIMERTITVRLPRAQDEALTRRARMVGKTRSALVRDLLSQALADVPVLERAGHVRGSVRLAKSATGWAARLRSRNWR